MYSEKIEKLIELALADGELTEKKKQILFKKYNQKPEFSYWLFLLL